MESEMELIQAFAVALRSKGFGVALHTARGAAVKYQVLPLHLANPLPFNPAHSHLYLTLTWQVHLVIQGFVPTRPLPGGVCT